MKKVKYAKIAASLVTIIMILSVFSMITANAANAPTANYTISQMPAHGFKFVGNLNPDQIVTATIAMPPSNIALMQYYATAISTPGSPLYHHFMTSSQIVTKFINSNKYYQVLNYVNEKGFKVEMTAMNSVIVISGTVQQIKDCFGMKVGLYSNGTAQYYNAYGTPSISGVYFYSSDLSSLFLSKPSTLITPQDLKAMMQKFDQVNPVASMEPYSPVWLQNVYNATGLYSKGIMGQGQTIGILDFFGDPYIQAQLNYFDSMFNLPNKQINITSIGPPYYGPLSGWAGEISLDVEISHTMAPLANITLYIGNYTWNLLPIIAMIDSYNSVDVLSQSFSAPESSYYEFGNASTAYYNTVFTDYYYLLGSLEGITFLASTGDVGATGSSAGTLGTVGYPSTSPWVTAMGGTTTYLTLNTIADLNNLGVPINGASAVSSFTQTAWSNYGFVPNMINYGGGTGGISMFEPMPWYQSGISLPSPVPVGYPDGRMVPDVSFEASPYPGAVFVFPYNQIGISGGTSESSPLFAGLLTLTAQYTGSRSGLINPTLYTMAQNSALYTKIFDPVTFGYIIPYVSTYGYNLATGYGSLNMGTFSYYLEQMAAQHTPSLSIVVTTNNVYNTTPAEFLDGSTINVYANITSGTSEVSSGSFMVTLESLQGILGTASLSYNSTSENWSAIIGVPTYSQGMSFLYVNGTSNGISGFGYTQVFLGYYVNYYDPSDFPLMASDGFLMWGYVTLINGGHIPGNITLSVYVESYSILNNTYYTTIQPFTVTAVNGTLLYVIMGNIPIGPSLVVTEGAYGYMPFYNGVDLQTSIILGNVVAEPGVAAPGTNIYVEGMAIGPVNTMDPNASINATYYSTITFSLVNSKGVPVSSVTNNFFQTYSFGLLSVPSDLSPGYYYIMITSTYYDFNLDQYLNGSLYGQIYVAPIASTPTISITPSAVYEGQNITVTLTVNDQNGIPIEYGMYMAVMYPSLLSSYYWSFTNFIMIPLYYNTATQEWEGMAEMPDGSNANVLSDVFMSSSVPLGYYLPGTYDLFVAGESASGIPTNTSVNTQYQLILREGPYLSIMEPTNSTVAYDLNSSTLTILGETSGVQVTVNGISATLVNGSFTVTENLVSGINMFTIVSVALSGGTTTQTVVVLYLPQVQDIQNQLNQINTEISNLSALKSNVNTISSELTSLRQEVQSLNATYGINLSHLLSQINSMSQKVNSTKTQSSQSNLMSIIAVVLAVIAVIVAIIAVLMRPKSPPITPPPEPKTPPKTGT
jgi:subtilase family serine protease